MMPRQFLHMVVIPLALFTGGRLAGQRTDDRPIQPLTLQPAEGEDRHGDPLPPDAVARLGTVRFRHAHRINDMAFLHDGKHLVALAEHDGAPNNRALCVWDAATGKRVRTIDTGFQFPRGLAVLPQDGIAACLGFYFDPVLLEYSRNVHLFDVRTGEEEAAIEWEEPRGSETFQVAWVPDGSAVVTGSTDGTIRVWDRASKSEILSYKTTIQRMEVLEVSPDGQTIAVGGGNADVFLWRWLEGGEPQATSIDNSGVLSAVFSPDGKFLAVGTESPFGTHLIDVEAQKSVRRLGVEGRQYHRVHALAFTQDGKTLVTSDYFGNQVDVWDVEKGEIVRTIDVAPFRPGSLAISPDSRVLAVSGGDVVVRLWDLDTGEEVRGVPDAHLEGGIELAYFGGDQSERIVTGSHDGTARLWHAPSGEQLVKVEHDHRAGGFPWIRGVAASPDGRHFATAGADNTVRLWDAETGREVYKLPGHGDTGGRWQIAFFADGTTFASYGTDMHIRVWDVRTGKALAEHRLRPSGIDLPDDVEDERSVFSRQMLLAATASRFAPDASKLFLQMGDAIYAFDVATGEEIVRFEGYTRVGSLAASTAGERLATSMRGPQQTTTLPGGGVRSSSSKTHSLIVLDAATGEEVLRRDDLEGYAGDLAYSRDGKFLANAPRKSPPEIQIWTIDGQAHQTIDGFDGTVSGLEFSADGRHIAAGLSNATTLVWRINE